MKEPKFKVGDLVLYHGGLFRVKEITENGLCGIGDVLVPIESVRKASWRDEIRILKGGAK